jgi:conjugative transfer region lipoprotein (TIGR03751 family)
MLEIWNRHTGGPASHGNATRQLLDARATLRRPLDTSDSDRLQRDHTAYTRTAQNEIHSQFPRLPNPDLVMYVFAHLAGSDAVPIPGYATVFSLYQRVQYALPGERTEDY